MAEADGRITRPILEALGKCISCCLQAENFLHDMGLRERSTSEAFFEAR